MRSCLDIAELGWRVRCCSKYSSCMTVMELSHLSCTLIVEEEGDHGENGSQGKPLSTRVHESPKSQSGECICCRKPGKSLAEQPHFFKARYFSVFCPVTRSNAALKKKLPNPASKTTPANDRGSSAEMAWFLSCTSMVVAAERSLQNPQPRSVPRVFLVAHSCAEAVSALTDRRLPAFFTPMIRPPRPTASFTLVKTASVCYKANPVRK